MVRIFAHWRSHNLAAGTKLLYRVNLIRYFHAMRAPWIVAHRGASGSAPENTLAAFERAVALGAQFIETDLHLTRDARFVAIHDKALERTTNGRGAVRDYTLAELRELDAGMWYDRQFMGQKIPTLEEVLEFAREHDVVFYLEIKYDSAWGMHHALTAALGGTGNAARTIVISFDPGTVDAVRRLDASIMTGLLVEGAESRFREVGAGRGGAAALPPGGPDHRGTGRAGASVGFACGDLDGERRGEDEFGDVAAGVDGIMTDVPDRLRATIEDGKITAG